MDKNSSHNDPKVNMQTLILDIPKEDKIGKTDHKWPKVAENGQKGPKQPKIAKKGQKRPKRAKNDQKGPKRAIVKMNRNVKNQAL